MDNDTAASFADLPSPVAGAPMAIPVSAAQDPLRSAPQQSLSFTWRERCELFAAFGWTFSVIAMVQAVNVGQGRLALLSIPFIAVFSAAFSHFAEFTPADDLDPPTGMTDQDLDELIDEVDRLQGLLPARSPRPPQPYERPDDDDDDFTRLVRDALDELPHSMQEVLAEGVPVIVSDDGHTFHPSGPPLYGYYEGGTVIGDHFPTRILVFRDTLVEDYGHDPDELRRQVQITVRHELAHHLGEMSEHRIRELGL